MRRAVVLVAVLSACSGGQGESDGGTGDGGDGGLAQTGDPCPEGPNGCEGSVCLSGEGGQSYCSEYCESGTCPGEFLCQPFFFTDPEGNPADIRGACGHACTLDGECHSNRCEAATGACAVPTGSTQDVGQRCGATDGVCLPGLVCLAVTQDARVCVATCDADADPFCPGGEFCWRYRGPGGGVCWPGGGIDLNEPCTDHLQCGLGLLCISQTGTSLCRRGCHPADGDPGCATGTCLALEGRAYGFCDG